jgi:hypothetical protein
MPGSSQRDGVSVGVTPDDERLGLSHADGVDGEDGALNGSIASNGGLIELDRTTTLKRHDARLQGLSEADTQDVLGYSWVDVDLAAVLDDETTTATARHVVDSTLADPAGKRDAVPEVISGLLRQRAVVSTATWARVLRRVAFVLADGTPASIARVDTALLNFAAAVRPLQLPGPGTRQPTSADAVARSLLTLPHQAEAGSVAAEWHAHPTPQWALEPVFGSTVRALVLERGFTLFDAVAVAAAEGSLE